MMLRMGVKKRGHDRYDVVLEDRHVKRVYDRETADMLFQSGKRLRALGKPLPEVIMELRGSTEKRSITLDDYFARWIAMHTASPTSVDVYRNTYKRIKPLLGSVPVAAIDVTAIRHTVKALSVRYAPRTVQQSVTLIKSVLSDAYEDGLAPERPPRKIRNLPEVRPKREPRALSREEHARIVKAAPPGRTAMFDLWPLIGLRKSEMIGLHWDDIDGDVLTVNRQCYRGDVRLPKGGKTRIVHLCSRAQRILSTIPRVDAMVFYGENGYISSCNLTNAIRKAGEDAGVEMWAHLFRHTYGSWLLAAGAPVTYVAARMGHSDPTITMRVYSHELEESAMVAVARFEGWLSGTERVQNHDES